jgi:hypothetical protein
MANNNNEIMTFQNKENLKNLITDAENRFDKKYMTPNQFWSGYQQLIGAPQIEEVDDEPYEEDNYDDDDYDDDFGDSKKGVVSTTAGSDNFHAEGDAINEDGYVDANDMLQLSDFPDNSRFEQESPYVSGFKNPLLARPQFRAPKVVPAIRPLVYDDSIQSIDSLDSIQSIDSLDIGKSIFDIDTESDDDSLKTENVRIVEPIPKQEPEPKLPDVSVEDADDELIDEVPIKPHASENVVEKIENDEAIKLLMKQRSKIGTSKVDNLIFMYDRLKELTDNKSYDEKWKKANPNKKKTIVSKLFREYDQKKK